MPAGGTTGQVLEKRTGTDYDTTWATVSGGGGTATVIGPTPPPSPVVGQLWWRNSDGVLFVFYDDGTSQQWVPATPTVKGDPAVGAFRYVQATAATVWTITHGLAFRPNVTAVDSTGQAMWPGTVAYTATTVTLTFSAAVGGEAYLS